MIENLSISTDIIVAFPGESDEDFEDTIDVLEKVRFEQVFSFKYSPRPLTKAAEFSNQVDSQIASSRLQRLQQRHNEILDEIAQTRLNKEYLVYFEEMRDNSLLAGRSDENILVQAKGKEEWLGKIMRVKITNP